MPIKIFTLLGGNCPFGRNCAIDSQSCKTCKFFYRAGTGTFFWCSHPQEPAKAERKAPEIVQEKRKRGRPPGKAAKKPVKRRKTKK